MYLKSSDFEVTVASLLFEPEYYLFDFTADGSASKFLVISEENLGLAPFIDIRLEPLAQARFSISTRKLFSLESQHGLARPPLHFIFHHAFVCSTLLARCLNQVDAFFSLKEPWIVRRLSDFKRNRKNPLPEAQWREMFTRNLALLSKNYRSGSSTVIKATNVANNLLQDVMHLMPDSRIVYLYSDLQSFLVSNLKKPPETQQKMPGLYAGFAHDSDFGKRFRQYANPAQMSLLQVCALIWIANIYSLKQNAEKFGEDNLLKLHMSDLLASPADSLARVSAHFGRPATQDDIARMTHPEVMRTNAKSPGQQYGTDVRELEIQRVLDTHGAQVQETLEWAEPLLAELQLREFLHARPSDGQGRGGR